MKDQIIEIIDRNLETFTGENEAILHAAEGIEKMLGWKSYPENKPIEVGFYLVIQDGFDAVNFDWWASDMFLDYTDVIAFMPIPKYKKP